MGGRSQWGTWAMVPKMYHLHNLLQFFQFYKTDVLRLSEHGDVIGKQTIKSGQEEQTLKKLSCYAVKEKRRLLKCIGQ